MKKPEIKVVRFGAEDVIATSAAPKLLTWSDLGAPYGDSKVSFGGKEYGSNNTPSSIVTALKDYYTNYPDWSGDISISSTNVYFSIDKGKSYRTLKILWGDGDLGDYNGSYTYQGKSDKGYYWFYHQ